VKDERIKKQLTQISALVPEFAIISALDDIPGIISAKIPKVPYGPQVNVAISNKKTLYLYRFKMVL
jgi:hypothetical protein